MVSVSGANKVAYIPMKVKTFLLELQHKQLRLPVKKGLLLLAAFVVLYISHVNNQVHTGPNLRPSRGVELSSLQCSNFKNGITIWSYPHMPKDIKSFREKFKDDSLMDLLCGYPSVCQEILPDYTTKNINLREITRGTIYEPFVSHHSFYKVLHGENYVHHVQSITTCAIVLSCGVDHIILSQEENMNNHDLRKQCLEYDPTQADSTPIFGEALASPGPNENPYAILGYDSRVKIAKVTNSGDEVQALAALQFLPEHTMTVDRDTGYPKIKDGSSPLMIANAWYGFKSKFPPPMPTEKKNNNIVFTSMHFSAGGRDIVKGNHPYWDKYTSVVGPIGARDIVTLEFLQNRKIPSYLSLCMTLTFQMPRLSSLDGHRGDEIIMVDVAKTAKLPDEIVHRATKLECDIPKGTQSNEEQRHEYANNLLSTYADRAKVVITSRIHSALPATAIGIPVIFVEDTDKNLPGGGGGRTKGISDLFHVQHAKDDWQYGNLDEPLPPIPGIHRVDRYRANFWSLLKQRSHIFEETARLYGMIPLQRKGKHVGGEDDHNLFHFIFTSEEVHPKTIRAIEYVFYHHPNAQVIIHCKAPTDLIYPQVDTFVEAGYDLILRQYNMELMLRDIGKKGNVASQNDIEGFIQMFPELEQGEFWSSHERDILQSLIMYLFGGVYLDIDVLCLKTLKKNFMNILGEEDENGTVNGSLMIFEPEHPFSRMALQWILEQYNTETRDVIGPQLISTMIRSKPQFPESLIILQKERMSEGSCAIHLENEVTSKFLDTKDGIPCDKILNKFCIFCHEILTADMLEIKK